MTSPLSEQVKTNLAPDELTELRERAEYEQRSVAWIVRRAVLAYLTTTRPRKRAT